MNCEILAGGSLKVGDVVKLESGSFDASSIDDGGKKAAFTTAEPQDEDGINPSERCRWVSQGSLA